MPQAAPEASRIAQLGLPSAAALQLQEAIAGKQYITAETVLLEALKEPASADRRDGVLVYLGGVYFAAGDALQAAVAWKKADALVPLEPPVRFSLAMAYVRLHHGDWARGELAKLASGEPQNALYPYWLGRVAYDGQQYDAAIQYFRQAITLDPRMARAHDNLGLCYFYLNQNTTAEAEFRRSIALETQGKQAAWPHLNLAIELEFTNQLDEAVQELRRALVLDPALPQAEFELGNALERQHHLNEAKTAFQRAAQLDPSYAEPHFALARLLRREGDNVGSQQEVLLYQRLHAAKTQGAPAEAGAP